MTIGDQENKGAQTVKKTLTGVLIVLALLSCHREPEITYDLAALKTTGSSTLEAAGQRLEVEVASVPAGAFGSSPVYLGRPFVAQDHEHLAPPTVVLTHGLWEHLGSRPNIIGTTVSLDGVSRTVVGITAASPRLEEQAGILVPR